MDTAGDSPDITIETIQDPEWIRRIIVWVEDTKIRQLEVSERDGLKSTDKTVWSQAVREYVGRLKCPVPIHGDGSSDSEMLSLGAFVWVLAHAVALAYDDGNEGGLGYNEIMEERVAKSSIRPEIYKGLNLGILKDIDDPKSVEAFQKVCDTLSVRRSITNGSGITLDDVSKCAYRIEREIIPLLKNGGSFGFSLDDDEKIRETIPLGFSTGDDMVDLAARVLRILHIKELRRLQNAIDDAIVKHQDLTANPRTETGRHKKKKTR
jgi:RLL motif-containing protein 1